LAPPKKLKKHGNIYREPDRHLKKKKGGTPRLAGTGRANAAETAKKKSTNKKGATGGVRANHLVRGWEEHSKKVVTVKGRAPQETWVGRSKKKNKKSTYKRPLLVPGTEMLQ